MEENGNLSIQTVDGISTLKLTKGSLGSVIEASNSTVPGYLKFLDSVGNAILENVNSIHESGTTNTEPQLTGISFFESYSEGNLGINSDILNDVSYIATSSDGKAGTMILLYK